MFIFIVIDWLVVRLLSLVVMVCLVVFIVMFVGLLFDMKLRLVGSGLLIMMCLVMLFLVFCIMRL